MNLVNNKTLARHTLHVSTASETHLKALTDWADLISSNKIKKIKETALSADFKKPSDSKRLNVLKLSSRRLSLSSSSIACSTTPRATASMRFQTWLPFLFKRHNGGLKRRIIQYRESRNMLSINPPYRFITSFCSGNPLYTG